jgi:DNA-nicking Smr family endonuclease
MKKRRLNKEEAALWDQVAKTMQPLRPPKAAKISETKRPRWISSKPKSKPTASLGLSDLKVFEIGSKSQTALGQSLAMSRTGSKAPASKPILQMDQKSFVKMRRGKLAPEARIDLHGMTLNQAHPALTQFILSAQRAGRRLVLVITGKGECGGPHSSASRERGVLRRQVPQWLHAPSLRHAILQVDQAHISHGGEGAYYVYLKKRR